MSISVKNISLSINDAVSKQFNIELDGVKYSVDNFKLTQKLLEPCRLEFKLRKSPEEDISEIQFTTCGSIIGKDVKLTLQTDSVEQEISGFAAGTQNADIEFEGFVTSAKATRSESEYGILVVAETIDTIMKDSPDFDFYNEMTLADIVNDVFNPSWSRRFSSLYSIMKRSISSSSVWPVAMVNGCSITARNCILESFPSKTALRWVTPAKTSMSIVPV